MRDREIRTFSGTLFGYTAKSNVVLMLVITLVFCIFTVATNAATYMLSTDTKELADEEFTPRTGIVINLHVLPTGQLSTGSVNTIMLSVASGTAPDVALSVEYNLPNEFAFREAVCDSIVHQCADGGINLVHSCSSINVSRCILAAPVC